LNHAVIFAICIGLVAGLRSFTPPAVVSWAAHFGALNLAGSRLAFMGSLVSAIVFSLFAIGELIGDKLPQTPRRTAIFPLVARMVTGGLCGACFCAAASQSLGMGIFLGATSAIIGAFVGYQIRAQLVRRLPIKDFVVAICEDLVAIGLACFLAFR